MVATTKVRTNRIKGGVEYAKVADRLKQFRSDYPRSKVSTKNEFDADGNLISRTFVWKDKVEFYELLKNGIPASEAMESADSEGSSFMKASKVEAEKGYEKNETIAVGRALALLGYAADGEIASSEEMEEFEAFKQEKASAARFGALVRIRNAQSMDELQSVWKSLTKDQQLDKTIQSAKDERKEELSETA